MPKILIAIVVLFFSCTLKAQRLTIEEYVEQFKEIAMNEMRRSGVPASITLAQGILESESGNSELVKKSNNHFGIKCKSNWTGETVTHDDDANGECFRAYNNASDSYKDHSDFLKANQRYGALFNINPEDYTGWAKGLKKAGYATNPRYPELLIKYIEQNNLQQYSLLVLNKLPHTEIAKTGIPTTIATIDTIAEIKILKTADTKKSKTHLVAPKEGLYAIARIYKVTVQQLKEWNKLESDDLTIGQEIIVSK
jgi:Mannosyl-glycoprotein endo-beta-N-acetylglucosaminidase/LysM domain